MTDRSEEHTSELQSRQYLVCRLLLEKKNVALTVGVFLLLFGAGLWAFTRMGHRFAMVERGVGLVKKKRRIAFSVFFFNDTATTEIYTLSLHDALPIYDLLSDFYGVDPADLVEYICKIPFMNTQATEFFIAQVQPGQMDTVKAALEARQAALQSQWSQYLPAQLELVENYKLVTSGDYILFAVTEYADDVVNDFNNNVK